MPEGEFQLGRIDGQLVTRAKLIAEARSWLGTRFMHQHSMKQVGCDCIGFMRGIAKGTDLVPLDRLAELPPEMFGYGPRPDGVTLKRGCDEHLNRIDPASALPGDIILIRFGRLPQHLALLGDYTLAQQAVYGNLSMIHALGPGGPGKVVEHRLDETWRKRIVAAYSIPGVE